MEIPPSRDLLLLKPVHQQRAPPPRQRRHIHRVPLRDTHLRGHRRDNLPQAAMAFRENVVGARHHPGWLHSLRLHGLPVHRPRLRLGLLVRREHVHRFRVRETHRHDRGSQHLGIGALQQPGGAPPLPDRALRHGRG